MEFRLWLPKRQACKFLDKFGSWAEKILLLGEPTGLATELQKIVDDARDSDAPCK